MGADIVARLSLSEGLLDVPVMEKIPGPEGWFAENTGHVEADDVIGDAEEAESVAGVESIAEAAGPREIVGVVDEAEATDSELPANAPSWTVLVRSVVGSVCQVWLDPFWSRGQGRHFVECLNCEHLGQEIGLEFLGNFFLQ